MAAQNSFDIINFFPLYNILHTQVSSDDNANTQLTDDEIKDLLNKITSLDKTGKDMIYVWVRIHSLRNSNSKLMDVPYGGTKLDVKMQENDSVCDVKFDLRNFPPILNRMLMRFTLLHLRKMTEDSNRINLK